MTNEQGLSRRDLLRASAVVSVAGAVASGTSSIQRSRPPKDTETDRSAAYAVSMEPVGTVEFDAVPEQWLAYSPGYADMGVALGVADGLAAVGDRQRYRTDVYEELPGVGFEDRPAALDGKAGQIDQGSFRDIDADVHLMDPNRLVYESTFEFNAAAAQEIDAEVGPFVGNAIDSRNQSWHGYRYYTLYEAFEKVAVVFQQQERYEAFAALHDEWLAELQAEMPSASDRPDALLVRPVGKDTFAPLRIADRGTSTKQWRDLGVGDALADVGADELPTGDDGTIGYRTIERIDPDVLLVRGTERYSREEFVERVLDTMRSHEAGQTITAVQDGRVFRGGPSHQGPITNLFATERAVHAIYPDAFDGPLFDRGRVADIVTGQT
ncbi:iron complex transport system substrate-binding protein [Natronoarchaeum philippinense]|uniref:Iron complex transport system substrate-binding protein n=1 Tax=Natronoarchaeum philippinense TaxID=558529 RepID=A0A285P8U2_NATPI|nr:ABC transporter substrate-binding protein [Natronoarchaeum philippinense]SNZ16301.1 iron complex transport system substrate-binding protein [Natronoarchaeum philippinense]